jgi:hypothetical protein
VVIVIKQVPRIGYRTSANAVMHLGACMLSNKYLRELIEASVSDLALKYFTDMHTVHSAAHADHFA